MHSLRRRRLLCLLLGTVAAVLCAPRRRVYLTRSSVLPIANSAGSYLLNARDDKAYISVFGLDVATFEKLLNQITPYLPAPSETRRRPHLFSPRLHLAVIMYYLTVPGRQKSIAIVFGIVPSAVCAAIWSGLRAMRNMMEEDKETWAVRWPTPARMAQLATRMAAREPQLANVIGFVDGLNLRMYQPSCIDTQNAYYNGWLGDTYCSQVFVFLVNGEIGWASFNNPGSWHDSKIARGLYQVLRDPVRTPSPYAILADSAFPYGADVANKILSKPKENIACKEDDIAVLRRWEVITRERQAAEWGMRALRGAFGRLDLRLPVSDEKRFLILSAIIGLHNFRTRIVGLNQIKQVYFPEWQNRSK